jgi:hypothetical protein
MIGAIELLMIAIIFGIIYGRDAIDKTFKKRPDEGVVESFAEDVKEYYHDDPKRMVKLIIFVVSIIAFLGVLTYWVVTRYNISRMLGLDQ